ncbi:MAG: DUF6364 family protein [Planctomycetaceae bacterium]|jgi:hypothetical protein|nr:DUF6364 family protein [Planctomycetaceae bacterium]
MNKKLTLSLDANVFDFARDYSKKSHKFLSEIIENYFLELKTKKIEEKTNEKK